MITALPEGLRGAVESDAVLSECGKYRYRLSRRWGDGPTCGFIMLNPSTADASVDDPTIRRCIGFAKREGCGGLIVVNLYAFRATDPRDLLTTADLVGGPVAELHLHRAIADVDGPLIAAWGAFTMRGRDPGFWIRERYGTRLMCLGRTKGGHPRHPLYLSNDAPLIRLQETQ